MRLRHCTHMSWPAPSIALSGRLLLLLLLQFRPGGVCPAFGTDEDVRLLLWVAALAQ